MAEVFGRKKSAIHITKKDLKQALVKANERLRAANAKMDDALKSSKNVLKSIESDYTNAEKDLEAIHDLQGYAKNELGVQQAKAGQVRMEVNEASSELKDLQVEASKLEENNKDLKAKEVSLSKSVALLEDKKSKSRAINAELKAIKKEEEDGQETLELLAIELNELEVGVESYISRKSAAESDFRASKAKIEREKDKAIRELYEVKERMADFTLASGQEMGRMDKAIAERISELQDMDIRLKKKAYDLSTVQANIGFVEDKAKGAEERAESAIKKEENKVQSIRDNFKSWKVGALDEVARLKLKGKIDNIDKAGLKDLLDG